MFATKWGATGICSRPLPGAVSCAGSVSAGALAAVNVGSPPTSSWYSVTGQSRYCVQQSSNRVPCAANAPAETDPAQLPAPGIGLLQMPVAPHFVANMPGYAAWRQPTPFAGETLFDAAHRLGLKTALVGQTDFHTLHLDPTTIDLTAYSTAPDFVYSAVQSMLQLQPHALILAALTAPRTADRHSDAARVELAALADAVTKIVAAAPGALIVLASRGAAVNGGPGADVYGPGSKQHEPKQQKSPNKRPGIGSGQPASSFDL